MTSPSGFNHLITEGPVRAREPTLGHLGDRSWAACVVRDIRHYHAPGVVTRETSEWVIFMERHILAEYLREYHEAELAWHTAAVAGGAMPTDDHLPIRRDSAEMRARRESFNRVRRGSPLLQQLRQEPPDPMDNRGLEWQGLWWGISTTCTTPGT